MVEIYLKNNTNYDKNGDITLDPTSCTYKDSEKLLTLEHFLDEEDRWKYIEPENVIAAEENGIKKLYRIYNVIRSLYSVTAFARPIFYDLVDKVLLDVRPTDKNGEEALNIILKDTGFTGHSNISALNTSYYVRKNIVESLIGDIENSFLNRWGGEFHCENFDVYINDRIGSDNGVRVEFGYNLNEIEEDVNIEEVVTRIIPVGFNGIMLEGNEPWVDSPLINKYTKPKMRVVEFSDIKVKENAEDEEGFNSIEEARAELIKQSQALFENGIDKPSVNYKIDMINLANTTAYEDFKMLVNVNKGDTITCYIPHLDIDVKARVIDYERDLLINEYISLELGNVVTDFFNKQADIQSTIDKITNNNGTVKAGEIQGIINAVETKFKALKDVAQPQDVRAIFFEDRVEDSPTFGCMVLGTSGFEIANKFKPGTKEWDFRTFGTGQGFTADYIVAGTMLADRIRGGVLTSIDGSLEIDLRETSKGMQFKKNGKKAIDISGPIINFYDWNGEELPIGRIYSTRTNYDENRLGVAIANEKGNSVDIAYKADNGSYYSYISFNKDKNGENINSPITIYEEIDFKGNEFWIGHNINSLYNSTSNNLVIKALNSFIIANKDDLKTRFEVTERWFGGKNNDNYYFQVGNKQDGKSFFTFFDGSTAYFYKTNLAEKIYCIYDFVADGNMNVNGDFTVSGNKNCVQKTENYGDRLFYSIEDCGSYLTDRSMNIFTVKETENGTYERVILIDNIFKEAVRTDLDYTVEIIKQGWGDYRIKEQTEDYFIVESDRLDFTFKYVITAKRRGFENARLKEHYSYKNEASMIENEVKINEYENN